jgi:hypothetical protein
MTLTALSDSCSAAKTGILLSSWRYMRALAEHGDGFAIVPRAEAFGDTVHNRAQLIPGTATVIDPSES